MLYHILFYNKTFHFLFCLLREELFFRNKNIISRYLCQDIQNGLKRLEK